MTATPATPTKAQGVDPVPVALSILDSIESRITILAEASIDHVAVLRELRLEAKCRDRVDQALQFLDDLEERGPVSFKALLKPLREILTGARDTKSIHSSGRKGPGFS